MVDELNKEEKERLFKKLDKVIASYKDGRHEEVDSLKDLDQSHENLDATDDYYYSLKNKEKINLSNKNKKHIINPKYETFFSSIQRHFDSVSFIQAFIYQLVTTIAYLLISFIIIKFLLINPTAEVLNKYISITWLALIAFDFPLFPVILTSAWVTAKPKENKFIYALLNSSGYFIWVFIVFLVFGLTKKSLLVYPGGLIVLFVLVTALVRGYIGYLLSTWYKQKLSSKKQGTKEEYKQI